MYKLFYRLQRNCFKNVGGRPRVFSSTSRAAPSAHCVGVLGDGAPSVLLRFKVWFLHRLHVFWFGFGLGRKNIMM